jgi:3-dehydroquinate dehydratase / shikimate dehydrogenase
VKGGVVVSVLEDDPALAARWIAEVPRGAAAVEIRADRLDPGTVADLVRASRLPAIVAAREPGDGGSFVRGAEVKGAIFDAALAAGASFVDVEWNGPFRSWADGRKSGRVILSHHGGPCDPGALSALYDAMRTTRASHLKIVPRASRPCELAAVRGLLRRAGGDAIPLTAFATEPAGAASRIFALSWGSHFTYGAVERGRETASGQIAARALIETFRVSEIGEATRRFALFGRPLSESPSPELYAACFAAAGCDGVYVPVDTDDPGEIPGLVDLLALEGFGVTIPLKQAVASRCVHLDSFAACGSVNTVRVLDEGWNGFNTDAPAALELLAAHLDLPGADIAIAGAGGTARSIGAALASAGAQITLYARDLARARGVAGAIGAVAAPWDALGRTAWDALVQATPLGRNGEVVVPRAFLTGRAVLDAAYGAEITPLVRDARRAGLAVVDGRALLVEQGVRQFARLTGLTPDRAVAAAAVAPHGNRGRA